MPQSFRAVVTNLLPSEERLLAHLDNLSDAELTGLAEFFSLTLPEVDAVIALPGAAFLAHAFANLRGLPVIMAQPHGESGRLALDTDPATETQSALIMSMHFSSGLPELEAVVQASRLGFLVSTVACALERTSLMGRSRLELQGIQVKSAVLVADTPRGLSLERRVPQPD